MSVYFNKKFKNNKQADDYELGIYQQASGDYKLAITTFSRLIDEDPAFTEAYNSLGLTFKKVKDFDNALKYYNHGIEAHFQNIFDVIKTNPLGEINNSYIKSESKTWVDVATQIILKNSSRDGIKHIRLPNDESTIRLLRQNPIIGYAFYDEKDIRYILPSYYSTIYEILKSDLLYSILLNNVGTLFAEIGDGKQAIVCFKESIEFIPKSISYDDPKMGLKELEL